MQDMGVCAHVTISTCWFALFVALLFGVHVLSAFRHRWTQKSISSANTEAVNLLAPLVR